jgi:hypothetical protein
MSDQPNSHIDIEIGGIQHPPVTYYGTWTLDTPLLQVFHVVTRQFRANGVQVLFKVKLTGEKLVIAGNTPTVRDVLTPLIRSGADDRLLQLELQFVQNRCGPIRTYMSDGEFLELSEDGKTPRLQNR